jgi:GxxExxY protein
LDKTPRGWSVDENLVGRQVVDAAIAVHREIGPGLLESVYELALKMELESRGLDVARQVPINVVYRGLEFVPAFRADLVVADKVLIELKCVETISELHKKQLLTYLRLSGNRLGYLLNFNEILMKQGIVRTVNGLKE